MKAQLVRGALGTGTLGIIHRGLGLATAILLARVLGAQGYGYYAFALGAVGVLAVPAQLGLPQLITREFAASHALEQWSVMLGLRRRSIQLAAAGALVATVFGCLLLIYSEHIPAIDPVTFGLALLLLPLMISMEVMSGMLRGLRNVIHAMWPVAALKPVAIFCILIAVLLSGGSFDAPHAMFVNLMATVAAVVSLTLLLLHRWPLQTQDVVAEYRTWTWLRSLLPFTVLGAANVITQKTDIVMLGLLASPSDVGVYHVAVQGAMLVSFGFTAVNAVLGPNIARLFARGETERLQRLLATTSMLTLGIALVVMTVLFLFGEALLQFVFGGEFRRGYVALLILGVGQLVNASVGSVGTFLSMTGYEGDTLRAISTAAIVNVVLNAVLIPIYGLLGAAFATMIATIIWNVLMAVSVYRRLGLIPGPIRPKRKSTN